MTRQQLQQLARDYADRIVLSVDFNVGDIPGAEHPERLDRIMTPIHDALMKAYIDGYLAATGGSEAA